MAGTEKIGQSGVGYLYVNGLNDGSVFLRDKLAQRWWRQAGLELRHAQIDWFEGTLDQKVDNVEGQVQEMLEQFGGVALIGASAGTSLALNTLFKESRHDLDRFPVCVVAAHGRVRAGEYAQNDRKSLYRRAGMDTKRPSQAFSDSVMRVENVVLPHLKQEEELRRRILCLTQLTDGIAPLETCVIDDVQTHRSMVFGHGGGYVAHMIADRDLIARFAVEVFSGGKSAELLY